MKIKKGYKRYTIRDISVHIKTGKTPPTDEEVYYKDGTINWFTPSDIGGVSTLQRSSKKITQTAIEKKVAFVFEPNTILITCIGEIGRVGMLTEFSSSNQQITGIFVDETIVSYKFFYYWLLRNKDLLQHYSNYAVIPILNNSVLEKIPVFLPDLETQKKTVAQLELIQSIIDYRNNSTTLLDKIAKSVFLNMFGDPINNPKKIKKEKLNALGVWQSGGTPPRIQPKYFEGNIPWYTSGELNNIFISESKEKITDEAIEKTAAKKIEKGSLLLGMYDTAALKSSITTIDASCNQAIAFAKLDPTLCNPIYVYYAIQLSKGYYLAQRLGARQQNLSVSSIKNIEIPLPPDVTLQTIFSEKASKIFSHKLLLEQSLKIIETLFQSILQDVFNEIEVIKEEDIFEDLVKTFDKADYLKDRKRITYLIKALNENRFVDFESYEIARTTAFDFLEEKIISQAENQTKGRVELKIYEG